MADTVKLRNRFEQLWADSTSFRSSLVDIEKYIMLRVGDANLTRKKSEGEATWKDPDVWDFTAPVALAKLASHVHVSITPPGVKWALLEWEDPELQEDDECRKWLEKNSDQLFGELEKSDFNGEASSAYPEYIGLGNTVTVLEARTNDAGEYDSLDFTSVPIKEVEFEEDHRGRIMRFYRVIAWTPGQILERFEDEENPGSVPDHIRERAKTAASQRIDVVFCVWERDEYRESPEGEEPLVLLPEKRPYGYCYFLRETGEQLGEEGGYYDFPVYIARYDRVPGSRWGRGLGHLALPHTKGLNAYVELVMTRAALDVDPPTKATERGMLSELDRRPGGITMVERMEDIEALDKGVQSRFDVGMMTLEEQRQELRRLFREDQLELKDSPQMTATEVQIRYDIMLKLLGPVLARLMAEYLTPMLEQAYRALFRAGRFGKAPDKALRAKAGFRVKFMGAIARSRRLDDVAGLERGAAFVAGLLKMGFTRGPKAFDDEECVRQVFGLLGAPTGVLRSKARVEEMAREEQAMQMRMAQAQASKDEAAAAASAAKANGAAVQASAFPQEPVRALNPAGGVVP
jgi:hypothetical protein